MKTEELIALLAKDVPPVDRGASALRFAALILGGAVGSIVVMLTLFGVRPDLGAVLPEPVFWLKLAFPTALSIAALLATARIGRPGVRLAGAWWGILAPFLILWVLAIAIVSGAPPEARDELVMGRTWRTCPINIALLAAPLWVAVLWAMKGLAPTQLRFAGALGGLLAGAISALVYSLHCPEMQPPFWAVWYVLGIALPVVAGALVGPRILRW